MRPKRTQAVFWEEVKALAGRTDLLHPIARKPVVRRRRGLWGRTPRPPKG